MMRILSLGALIGGMLYLSACWSGEGQPSPAYSQVETARRLQADVSFLASDLLEGRGTPSRGLDLAALYLETQLRVSGV